MRRTAKLVVSALLVVGVLACGGNDGGAGADVVATTPVLGELARQVAEPCGLAVDVVMKAGTDPHEFQPSAQQAARLRGAAFVIENGGGYEQGLRDALDSSGGDGVRFIALDHVEPIERSGAVDPHFWHDPSRMAEVAADLGVALDDTFGDTLGEESCLVRGGARAAAELRRLDAKVEATLEQIPDDHRRLVLSHDAFEYLADRYEFEVVGALTTPQSQAEPSAAKIADLASKIENEGIPAVVGVEGEFRRAAQTLAAEASGVPVVDLFAESISDPPANTYASMVETNAQRLAEALA